MYIYIQTEPYTVYIYRNYIVVTAVTASSPDSGAAAAIWGLWRRNSDFIFLGVQSLEGDHDCKKGSLVSVGICRHNMITWNMRELSTATESMESQHQKVKLLRPKVLHWIWICVESPHMPRCVRWVLKKLRKTSEEQDARVNLDPEIGSLSACVASVVKMF